MKNFRFRKEVLVFLAICGLAALVTLSVALRDLAFVPPEPFSFDISIIGRLGTYKPGGDLPVWRYFMFGSLVLLILAVVIFIIDADLRRQILRRLVRFAAILAAIWFYLTYIYKQGDLNKMLNLPPAAGSAGAPAAGGSIPVFTPPQVNPWIIYTLSFTVSLALVLAGWLLYMRSRKYQVGAAKDRLAGIAREALDELQPGRSWDDAIVRAYVRMNEVVGAERGLIRQPGNTPAEFAARMERIGLPGEAVRALTGLFEAVRYGGRSSSPADRDLAAAALSAILHSCGRNA